MGKTVVSKRQRVVNPVLLTDKQQKFVDEYVLCRNGTKAAIAAGYSKVSAQVTASRLLQHPLVSKAVARGIMEYKTECKRRMVGALEQIVIASERDGADAIDPKTGKILPLNKLPKSITLSMNSIKQKVTSYVDQEGNSEERVETEFTLVPKQTAWDMALKVMGEYAPDKLLTQDVSPKADWESLYGKDETPGNIVDVEARLLSSTPVDE